MTRTTSTLRAVVHARSVFSAGRRSRIAAAPSSSSSSETKATELKVLYDGECPLCVREVNFLKSRNERKRLEFVDISNDEYDTPFGIEYEDAMREIHGIYRGAEVIKGVRVFDLAYNAVGLGWVYSFSRIPALLAVADKIYDVWAKYRLEITGRPNLKDVIEARKRRLAAGGGSSSSLCKTEDGKE